MAFYSQWLWICFLSVRWVGWGDTVTFCSKNPFKDTGAPADLQLQFLFFIFFAAFQMSESENGSGGKFNTMSVSFLNNLHLQNYCFYSTDWLHCEHCHSMKNTSGLSSIKSPSKSPTVTGKQNTLEGSPLNGIQHSLTVPCLLWRDKMSTVRPVHHHSHFRDEFITRASYKSFKSKTLEGHLKQNTQTQRLCKNTRNNCNRWTHTGLI